MAKNNNRQLSDMETIDPDELVFSDDDEFSENFDPSEDAFKESPPIPDGLYSFKLKLAEEDTVQRWENQSGKTDVKVNMIAEVVAVKQVPQAYQEDELTGSIMFPSVSTAVPRGKRTCTMAGFLRELAQVPAYAKKVGQIPTHKQELFAKFMHLLKSEPILDALTEWRASEEDEKGEGNWKLVKRGMDNFALMADGRRNPVVKTKKGEVTAKAKIKRFVGPETQKSLAAAGSKGNPMSRATAVAKGPVQPKPLNDDDAEIEDDEG